MEIKDENIKEFQRIAKKYGVDFAVQRDKSALNSNYLVFFKARDADALQAVMNEYTYNMISKKERKSVLDKLNKFKEKVAAMPKKTRTKRRERQR